MCEVGVCGSSGCEVSNAENSTVCGKGTCHAGVCATRGQAALPLTLPPQEDKKPANTQPDIQLGTAHQHALSQVQPPPRHGAAASPTTADATLGTGTPNKNTIHARKLSSTTQGRAAHPTAPSVDTGAPVSARPAETRINKNQPRSLRTDGRKLSNKRCI